MCQPFILHYVSSFEVELMATKQGLMWKVMEEHLPRNKVMSVDDICNVINLHIKLQPDDFDKAAPNSNDLRWRRNVRNILQARKKTSKILWISHDAYLMPSTSDKVELNSSFPKHTKMSKEQFEKLQEIRKKIGEAGEKFVLDKERERLSGAGRHDFADKVIQISEKDVRAGYDILSFEETGEERYVEVKTSVGNSNVFEFSAHELDVSKAYGKRYCIYMVRDIGDKPTMKIIRDPASKIGDQLSINPSSYICEYFASDGSSKRSKKRK